ncbi:MAG: hypothetical protein RIA71_14950 [Oceanicaulis sp.]
MRELQCEELDCVFGGKLPDEDLQDMRDENPNADTWQEVVNEPPPMLMCFEGGPCYDVN